MSGITRLWRSAAGHVLLATLAFVLSPMLTMGFNGFTPSQFPVPQINAPVQPAGYAFSIWGVIYLWLIAGAGYGFWRAAGDPGWQPMRRPLTISLAIGAFWIAAAGISPPLATLMIFAMATAAIIALLRAGDGQPWLQARPVALYSGWLTAASGVALGVVLGGYAILPAEAAAILSLVGVLSVTLLVQAGRPREWAYPAAVVWALIGVIAANPSGENWKVLLLAASGIVVLTVRAALPHVKGRNL